jgi:hypothetical protein
MLTIHSLTKKNLIGETVHNVYMGSSGNKFIFNIAPSNEPKPVGGYDDLKHICYMHDIELEDVKTITKKAEEIMGRTLAENKATAK